jgi:imidazolonepropionase-like amidohydrolase
MSRRRWSLLPLALSLSACAPEPPAAARPAALPPAAPTAIAFVDVTVVPLDSERLLAGHTVVVRGDRIVAVGPAASVAVPPGARIIEGRGRFLLPGLADMHAHLTREEDLHLYLARGVTTVRNMWGAPLHLAWRDRIRAGELAGPTLYTAGPIVDGAKPAHDGSLAVQTEEEAERAVALHRQAGYDFVKVYSRLEAPVFERVLAAARRAGLPVAGHVPRAVGLGRALDAGQLAVEHLNSFDEALQAQGSPLAGKWDGASQDAKIDHVDLALLPGLVQHIRERGAWICPTRNLLDQGDPVATRRRLDRPEMRYVPGYERAIWTSSGGDPSPEATGRHQRTVALGDRVLRALHEGGAHLLVGTDTGNPLVIPGYTLHEELALFVAAGFTPYQALRAATHDAAVFLGAEAEVGTVTVGKRADLLLVDGNPLADVEQADRIRGVMARGRWLGDGERAALLSGVEAWAKGQKDPFAGMPPLVAAGAVEFSATFLVLLKDVPFDHERVLVERRATGERVIQAQTMDPHRGQGMTLQLVAGAAGLGSWMTLDSDGANGRGRITATRTGAKLGLRGTVLAGVETAVDADVPEGAWLGADHFLAGKILLAEAVGKLAVGASREVQEAEVALGSFARAPVRSVTLTRIADATVEVGLGHVAARRYELRAGQRAPDVLLLDERGWPVGFDITSYGVSFRRLAR